MKYILCKVLLVVSIVLISSITYADTATCIFGTIQYTFKGIKDINIFGGAVNFNFGNKRYTFSPINCIIIGDIR